MFDPPKPTIAKFRVGQRVRVYGDPRVWVVKKREWSPGAFIGEWFYDLTAPGATMPWVVERDLAAAA